MWQHIFGAANLLAIAAWLVLALSRRQPWIMQALFYGPLVLLCAGYVVGLVLVLTGAVPTDGGADFSTIEGVRQIFASDAGATIGWVHYLAFDLFAGLWIARNADAMGIHRLIQLPVLALTFLAGPAGLLAYILLRAATRKTPSDRTLPA